MAWTLTSGATTKSLEAWGITGMVRRRNSQAVDTLAFVLDGAAYDGAPPFAADSEVVVTKDSTTWFRGRVTAVRPEADGRSERLVYEVSGPWWYLERLVYQQPWAIVGSSDVLKTHCLLNLTTTGGVMTTRAQIDDVLTLCADAASAEYGSAPFQWTDTDLPALEVPSDEVRDVTCAEVIRKQLRWMPDAVAWFDYTTSPPTFRCKRRADLTEVDVALGDPVSVVSLVPRYDLQVPAVVLKFESTSTVDGATVADVSLQVYPPGSTGEEFGAMVATVDLLGGMASHATATISASALPTTDAGWWSWLQSKAPWLASTRVTLGAVQSVARQKTGAPAAAVLGNELVSGQVPGWIGATVQQETVTIRATYSVTNHAESVTVEDQEEVFTVNIITTDASSGSYSSLTEFVAGETAPSGLAQALYDALNPLQWQGAVVFEEDDLSGTLAIGHAVNLTGGRAEWATMAAVVQTTEEDVDQGTTRVEFGPPQHLGPRDMLELLRVNRYRLRISASNARDTGAVSSGAVALGEATPVVDTTGGLSDRSLVRVRGTSGGEVALLTATNPRVLLSPASGSTYIDLDLSAAPAVKIRGTGGSEFVFDTAECGGYTIQLQEVAICVNGVEKRMLILASVPYDP